MESGTAAVILVVAAALSACTGQYSEDPVIAQTQKWAESCGQMKQGILTALQLGQAGHLSETEAQVIDRVNIIYRAICTGPPADMAESLKAVAVKAAVGELCPELVVTGDDVIITVTQAAACAARKALVVQLEKSA